MPLGGQAAKRCHIHWLPIELLSMIFLLCHDMDPRPQIVLACKWWLNVARYYKLLWIDIDLHKPEQALRRMMWAQGAPLEVRFAPPYAPRDDPVVFLRALRKAWPQLRTKSIRSLELDRDMPTLARSIPIIAKSSSTLECISISPSQSEEDELFSADGPLPPLQIAHSVLQLSDAVLAAKFPRLKRLELADCTGSWTSDLYRSPNLRILKIQMSENVTIPAVPFGEVMATICSLVSLRELSLIGCLPPLAGLCPYRGTTVHGVANLRTLETLVLRSTPDRCMFLMRHLQYPPTCRLFITCTRPAQNGVARYLIGRTVEPSMYAYRVVVNQDKIVVDASKDQDGLSWTRNLQLALTVGALPPQESALESITNALLSVRANMLSLIPAQTVYFPLIVQNVCMHTTATVLHLDWSKTNRYALHDALTETAFAFQQGVFPHLKVLIMDQLNLRIPVLLGNVLPDPAWYRVYEAEKAALAALGGELANRHRREENKFGTLKFVSCVGFQPGAWPSTPPMKWLGEEGVGEIERWAQRMEEL